MYENNAFKFDTIKRSPGVYQEMWFFDFQDVKQDISFFLNFNVNVARLFKFNFKIADVVAQVTINGQVFHNEEDDGFYKKFTCDKERLCFIFGKGDIVIEDIGNDSIHVKGREKKSNFGFDFIMKRIFQPWHPVKLTIGAFKEDSIVYYPYIPLGKINGKISINDKHYDIDGYGYHDHDWGYLTSIQWNPWLIVKGKNVIASIVKTPLDSLVHFQDDDMDFFGRLDSITFDDMDFIKKKDSTSTLLFPHRFLMESRNGSTGLKIETTSSNSKNLVNMGFDGRDCLALHDNKGTTRLSIDGKIKYDGLSTSVYYWNLLKF